MKEINLIETWMKIDDFNSYMISNLGRIKSFKFIKERVLTPGKNKRGYLCVILYKNKKSNTKTIHRLTLENFKPVYNMSNLQVNHINGIKIDNRLENLEWCTPTENIKHAIQIGLIKSGEESPLFGKHHSEETRKLMRENHIGMFGRHHSEETLKLMSEKQKGENNPNLTLKEKDVIEIWKHINEGILTQKQIGEKFGVSNSTISRIKTGMSWKHLKIGDTS